MPFNFIIYYLIFINAVGFALMGIDKKKAREHKWRISEKKLFFAALLGGSIGTTVGMHLFRHKTRHWYFVVGMPAIFLAQAVLLYFFLSR